MLHFPKWKIYLITGICMLFVWLAIPSFIPEATRVKFASWMPQKAVSLGLDLQGGSQLLLEVDFDVYMKDQLTNVVDEIRTRFRENKVGYKGLNVAEGQIHFSLREKGDADIAAILRKISPEFDIKEEAGDNFSLNFNEGWKKRSREQIIGQSLEIVNRRVNETGTKEPIIQRQGDKRILLQVPGLNDPEHLKVLLGRTAKMTFHLVNTEVGYDDLERNIAPAGTRILGGDDRKKDGKATRPEKYAVFNKVEISGDMLVDAHPSYDDRTNEPIVSFRLNNAGARRFGEVTAQNVGKPFAVVLDNKVITAPRINTPILGGSGYITGASIPKAQTISRYCFALAHYPLR